MPTHLAPALEVFPTLARFALHPRRLYRVPVGCRSDISREDLQRSILHLYHDLGVLVFAGCSNKEVQRIGDVLRQVVTWGGPGGMVSMLDDRTLKYQRAREEEVKRDELHDADGEKHEGILRSETILRLAKLRLGEQLRERVAEMRPVVKAIHTREVEVVIPSLPLPRGINHQTVQGARPLPVESWGALSVDRRGGQLVGEIRFFAAGTGDYLGEARLKYLMFRWDEEKQARVPFWAHGRIPERHQREVQVVMERTDKVVSRVMEPLWRLERSVWADKARRLAKSREQAEWESLRSRDAEDGDEIYGSG